MKSTVLAQAGISILKTRMEKLHPSAKRLWGKMHVTGMINHCNAVNRLILNGTESDRKTAFKQIIAKILFLYLPFRFPKNVKAPKVVIQSKENTSEESFDTEKELFIKIIDEFPGHPFPAKMYHPAFGNLSPKQWGVAAWRHMDHHLRQFGV